MASTIVIPSLPSIQTNPAEQAKQAVAVATAASTDIAALQTANTALIQKGVATLTAGDSGAIAATVTASTRIIVTLKTANTTTLTTNYAALSGDRVVGAPGSFKIKAVVAAGTINVADVSTVDWLAIG